MKKAKNVLMSCLNSITDSNYGLSDLTKQLLFLHKSLEMDEREREGFMKRQMQRIFPGNFGKMLVINYSPFLNASINTKEKEEAWLNMVEFLDEVESIEYPYIYSNTRKKFFESLNVKLDDKGKIEVADALRT